MSKQQKLVQSLGELAFPLIGMFYLEWSLYFIVLFYLLDTFANELFYHIELKRIFTFRGNKQKDKTTWWRSSILQLGAFLFLIFIAHFAMFNIYPKIDLWTEFVRFLLYEEDLMPIPQVYVLLPLVLLPKYMQYKNDFIAKQKQRVFTVNAYIALRKRAWLLTLALASFLYSLSFLIQLTPVAGLFCLLLPKFVYDFWLVKN